MARNIKSSALGFVNTLISISAIVRRSDSKSKFLLSSIISAILFIYSDLMSLIVPMEQIFNNSIRSFLNLPTRSYNLSYVYRKSVPY